MVETLLEKNLHIALGITMLAYKGQFIIIIIAKGAHTFTWLVHPETLKAVELAWPNPGRGLLGIENEGPFGSFSLSKGRLLTYSRYIVLRFDTFKKNLKKVIPVNLNMGQAFNLICENLPF